MCGGSNLSTDLLLWGIYIKKCISPVRICLQSRKARNASTKFRKTSESKKAEKSLEISAFLVFSCLHLNQTLIMAGVAGFGPTHAGVKVPCLTAWLHPITHILIVSQKYRFVKTRGTICSEGVCVAGYSSLQFTYPPPCAPFSAVERGEGPPRRRFCCFGRQLRWIPRKIGNKDTTNQRTEFESKPV